MGDFIGPQIVTLDNERTNIKAVRDMIPEVNEWLVLDLWNRIQTFNVENKQWTIDGVIEADGCYALVVRINLLLKPLD